MWSVAIGFEGQTLCFPFYGNMLQMIFWYLC